MKQKSNQFAKKVPTSVEQLVPNQRIKNLELVILRMYPTRMVVSESYTGPVAAGCGRDHTGLVGMVFWNEQIQTFQVGDIVRIESGWCKLRNGHLVVSTGRTGKIVLVDR
ncbi:MAG: hypothetical protein O2866_05230 [archaeon]|nr:hypothetical protein [archaeon]MDA0842677.1 hypothetical protein [archaeon]MDA1168267.1 hypothetical protein [archaeon]